MSNQPVYRRPRGHAYSCRCPRCQRSGAYSESLLKGGCLLPVAFCAVIGGVVCVAMLPLAIWHTADADGQAHPDAATWVAYGAGGTLLLAGMMFLSIRASRNRNRSSR